MPFELNFAYAYGCPTAAGDFRSSNEDFVVDEELGFLPSGEGEHLYVHIKKRGENTQWVAEKLAKYFNIKNHDVGFSGLKDRNAICSQWFSLYLPKNASDSADAAAYDWHQFKSEFSLDIDILSCAKHQQKLRRGTHQKNHFKIRLKNFTNYDEANQKLMAIKSKGVPNYFGEQRFGRDGNNLSFAQQWISGDVQIKNRNKKSLIMSAARSFLFNHVLDYRVRSDNWNLEVDGDVLSDSSPTGPLWGRGTSNTKNTAAAFEAEALKDYDSWKNKLEHVGLQQDRRNFVLNAQNLNWEYEDNTLEITFALPPGEYATSVLREVAQLRVQPTEYTK